MDKKENFNIEKLLKQKYDEINVPERIFNTDKIFEKLNKDNLKIKK